MKRLLLFAALLGGTKGVYAQDCDAIAPPYTQDFEAVTAPNPPECTTFFSTGLAATWGTANNPGNGFTTGTLQYTGNSLQADTWFFTRALELETGKAYRLTFTYGNDSETTTEKLTVAYGAIASAAGMTNNINNYNAITGATATTVSIGPLYITEGGTYYFGFKANSEASQGKLFVDNISIVPWVCETVNNLKATDVTTNSATITWEAVTGGESVQFQQTSLVLYGEEPVTTGPTTGGLFKELADLTPGTTYTASVRTFCSGTWGEWESINFTTPVCNEVASIPYTQDFETATTPGIPACNLALAGETGGNWATANAPGSGFTTKALTYAATDETADAWFFTQGFELEAGGHYKVSYTYGNNGATAENLSVALVRAPGPIWATTFFAQHTGITGATPVNYVHGSPFSINEENAGVYYLAFRATSAASQGSLFVDNIKVDEWTCGEPAAITVTDVTASAATVTWTAPVGDVIMGYFYAYNTTGETPVDFDMNPGATLNLENLEANTTYYVFVKSFCGPIIGEWAEPVSFTTDFCDVVAGIPYIQDFETATTPEIPECNLGLAGETGGSWATANAPGSGFTSKTLTYATTDETADAWFFTQGFELEAGGHYKVSYTYGNNGATTEGLSVALVTSPTPAGAANPFAQHNGITGGTPVTYVHGNPFTMNENNAGVYYLAFHATSAAAQGSLFVDNIKVEEWTCTAPSAITATDITTTTANITWVAPDDSVVLGYFYAYNTTGETPTEFTMNPGATLSLDELEPGTTYYVFVKSFCGPVIGEWAAPVTFTTQELVGITDVAFNGLAVYPNPSHNNITISNAQQIDSAALYNVAGQQVLQQSINATTGKIQLQQLPAGVYLLTLQAGNATKTIKVIKQ